ncbi:uncharacterized protein LOC141567501 [Rhinolophus sinicus]|uniref:uncharacterized protein LOC141567501 n=1 Tax=Rhinolophus sinicus TaxID=89399 RepID=UPI003D7A9FBA
MGKIKAKVTFRGLSDMSPSSCSPWVVPSHHEMWQLERRTRSDSQSLEARGGPQRRSRASSQEPPCLCRHHKQGSSLGYWAWKPGKQERQRVRRDTWWRTHQGDQRPKLHQEQPRSDLSSGAESPTWETLRGQRRVWQLISEYCPHRDVSTQCTQSWRTPCPLFPDRRRFSPAQQSRVCADVQKSRTGRFRLRGHYQESQDLRSSRLSRSSQGHRRTPARNGGSVDQHAGP